MRGELSMTQTQTNVPSIAVQMESQAFSSGFTAGLTNTFCPDDRPQFDVSCMPTEQGIVDVIRNACELAEEGRLTEELLRFSCGLIAGWVSRQTYPQEQPLAPVSVSQES
jgi:hypothetical protein